MINCICDFNKVYALAVIRRSLLIESKGGLGNQLFSYFYGIFLANSTSTNIEIVTVDNHHENSNLDSIKFMGPSLIIPKVTKSRWKILIVRLLIFINKQSKQFIEKTSPRLTKINESRVVPILKFNSRVITGYFADFSFYDSLGINGSNLLIQKPSVEYLIQFDFFEKRRFIAFHIRYGDFLSSDMKDSVLNYEFYFEALKVIDSDFKEILDIVIFCDQPELLDSAFISDSRISVFNSESLSAFEVMKIMSCANAFVLCLSTFGFWSAKLCINKPTVIYPSCNTLGQTFIKGIPSNWVAQDPLWKIRGIASPE